MTTPNERRIRAGYDLFLAADPDIDDDWADTAPVAALMDDHIEWFDDEPRPASSITPRHFQGKGDGRDVANLTNPSTSNVLGRLRQLRSQMCCQIVSCLEDEQRKLVHTVDHALKLEEGTTTRRAHFCASTFEFNSLGKVVSVRYCPVDLPLTSPPPPPPPPESAS